MSPGRMAISPLTGHLVPTRGIFARDIQVFEDICGEWAVTFDAQWGDANVASGRVRLDRGLLSAPDSRRLLALARSAIWRASIEDSTITLFLAHYNTADIDELAQLRMRPASMAVLWDECMTLTMERKAAKTLQNLVDSERHFGIGTGVEIPYLFDTYPGEPTWSETDLPAETGLTYGCISTEAPLIYKLLESQGHISLRAPRAMGEETRVFVTPSGYTHAEFLATGAVQGARRAFVVCRFIDEIDLLFEAAIKPLETAVGIPICRIKDIHHVDRIDDRICKEIRESTIVIVDLTEQNFNVAFEAGYAVALNKPIVWITKKTDEGIKLPFDIHTYNCLDWDPADLQSFTDKLKYRIEAALNIAASRD